MASGDWFQQSQLQDWYPGSSHYHHPASWYTGSTYTDYNWYTAQLSGQQYVPFPTTTQVNLPALSYVTSQPQPSHQLVDSRAALPASTNSPDSSSHSPCSQTSTPSSSPGSQGNASPSSHPCSSCVRTFSSKRALSYHFRLKHRQSQCTPPGTKSQSQCTPPTTNQLKQHGCVVCGKVFSSRATLRVHERLHSGETPYQCKDCGKLFRDHSVLSRHRRTHTKERPFSCEHCGQAFSQRGNLKRHRRSKHGCL